MEYSRDPSPRIRIPITAHLSSWASRVKITLGLPCLIGMMGSVPGILTFTAELFPTRHPGLPLHRPPDLPPRRHGLFPPGRPAGHPMGVTRCRISAPITWKSMVPRETQLPALTCPSRRLAPGMVNIPCLRIASPVIMRSTTTIIRSYRASRLPITASRRSTCRWRSNPPTCSAGRP